MPLEDIQLQAGESTALSPLVVNEQRSISFTTVRGSAVHRIKRNAAGKLRPFDIHNNEISDLSVPEGKNSVVISEYSEDSAKSIEDNKQTMSSPMKSIDSDIQIDEAPGPVEDKQTQASWSPTIPNDSTPEITRYQLSTAEEEFLHDVDAAKVETEHRQEHGIRTQSTVGVTYQQDDTGYVNFDALCATEDQGIDDTVNQAADHSTQYESQDLPRAPWTVESVQNRPPLQTPAAPINPFTRKGSVLKGHEMFAATQPSAAKALGSPTSSRPSPDLHRASSPPKAMPSSPLQRYEPIQLSLSLGSSPLDSSNIVNDPPKVAKSFPESGVRQKGSGVLREPRDEYVPMAQSQERRLEEDGETESEDDSFELDQEVRRRQRQRRDDEFVQREFTALTTSGRPSSTTTKSASAVVASSSKSVEVPSTRRHSVDEDKHLNQCDGFNARDTQDEVIADSQGGIKRAPIMPISSQVSIHRSPERQQPALDSTSTEEEGLPLQEVSTNCCGRTPISSKDPEGIVPETSPLEDRIKPLSHIASFSIGPETDNPLVLPPGFTPDKQFNKLMHLHTVDSPMPRRKLDFDNAKAYDDTGKATENVQLPEVVIDAANDALPHSSVDEGEHSEMGGTKTTGHAGPTAASAEASGNSEEPRPILKALRSKEQLKGPSRTLRRTSNTFKTPAKKVTMPSEQQPTSRRSRRQSTVSGVTSTTSTPLSSLPASMASVLTSSTSASKSPLALGPLKDEKGDQGLLHKKTLKRKASSLEDAMPTRSAKRRSLRHTTEEGEDPLAASTAFVSVKDKIKMFAGMAFSVTFLEASKEKEKKQVGSLISRYGGQLLDEGLQGLFEADTITPAARRLGFTAIIADRHSRKAKYMQALALGLPCLSYRWIIACVEKGLIIDWTPYLLCAGESTLLDGAVHSRLLQSYNAEDATFVGVVDAGPKLFAGLSLLSVKRSGTKSKDPSSYMFLIRAMSPARLSDPQTPEQARKKLVETEAGEDQWDILYTDKRDAAVEKAIFESTATAAGGTRKRKRGPTPVDEKMPAPKRIRIIDDEFIIQSLIAGHLIDE